MSKYQKTKFLFCCITVEGNTRSSFDPYAVEEEENEILDKMNPNSSSNQGHQTGNSNKVTKLD